MVTEFSFRSRPENSPQHPLDTKQADGEDWMVPALAALGVLSAANQGCT